MACYSFSVKGHAAPMHVWKIPEKAHFPPNKTHPPRSPGYLPGIINISTQSKHSAYIGLQKTVHAIGRHVGYIYNKRKS